MFMNIAFILHVTIYNSFSLSFLHAVKKMGLVLEKILFLRLYFTVA